MAVSIYLPKRQQKTGDGVGGQNVRPHFPLGDDTFLKQFLQWEVGEGEESLSLPPLQGQSLSSRSWWENQFGLGPWPQRNNELKVDLSREDWNPL